MTNSKARLKPPAGEPALSHNGYRFYEQQNGEWLVVDGQAEDARRAASFALPAGATRPSNLRFHGLYSTQRLPLEALIERFVAQESTRRGTCGQ